MHPSSLFLLKGNILDSKKAVGFVKSLVSLLYVAGLGLSRGRD
jgi:hypothetical protein